jgi:hypothetical protein
MLVLLLQLLASFAFAGVPYRQLLVSLLQVTTLLLLASLTLLYSSCL